MPSVSFDTAVKKANELLSEYEKEYNEHYKDNIHRIDTFMSFGEWVLQKHYPSIDRNSHPSISNMCTTVRTSDARTWLIANLRHGRLPL